MKKLFLFLALFMSAAPILEAAPLDTPPVPGLGKEEHRPRVKAKKKAKREARRARKEAKKAAAAEAAAAEAAAAAAPVQ